MDFNYFLEIISYQRKKKKQILNANKTKTCIQSHLRKIISSLQGMYPKLIKEIKLLLRIFEKISFICI